MTDDLTAASEEVIRRIAGGLRATRLYGRSHPLAARHTAALSAALSTLHARMPTVVIGLLGAEVVVVDRPLPRVSAQFAETVEQLRHIGIERISISNGLEAGEVESFIEQLSHAIAHPPGMLALDSKRIRLSLLAGESYAPAEAVGITLRQLYGDATVQAEAVWESARLEGRPDIGAALRLIENLAEAVTVNRTAMIALAAMRSYDAYTFTHMVNVAILTMAQARSLGITGGLLREIGLAALMHDIGKVKTPRDIINKPSALDDREFEIVKRHPVDGAAMLRQTPDVPVLAPVVAFEHHLRLDGSGYPEGVARNGLNLATMLCAIADVYDAMRSRRSYHTEPFSTERILAVLKQNDGVKFDQHLLRRFVQLLGIYAPGSVVRLSNRQTGVVTAIHAPCPDRPRVRIIREADGSSSTGETFVDLWQEEAAHLSVMAVLDLLDADLSPATMVDYVCGAPGPAAASEPVKACVA